MRINAMHTVTASAKQQLAKRGEAAAARFIQRLGWSLLQQNWRAGKFGELDIIARDMDGCLVFIEVKTRRVDRESETIGFSAVDGLKRHKVVKSALRYLNCFGLSESDEACRFDVIVVNYPFQTSANDDPEILHVKDAFHGFGWG
jgi:putative endonuclease